jgi:hypothetical protein
MKTAEAVMNFPVLGFTPERGIWGFEDLNTLTSCGPRTLKNDLQVGMELIDSRGSRWVVRSVRRIGRDRPFLPWLLSAALSGPLWRIEQELDELAPVPLPEIKERACASVEATSSDYCADDEREEVLEPLLAKVRAAKSVAKIHTLLGLDSFMGY